MGNHSNKIVISKPSDGLYFKVVVYTDRRRYLISICTDTHTHTDTNGDKETQRETIVDREKETETEQ